MENGTQVHQKSLGLEHTVEHTSDEQFTVPSLPGDDARCEPSCPLRWEWDLSASPLCAYSTVESF